MTKSAHHLPSVGDWAWRSDGEPYRVKAVKKSPDNKDFAVLEMGTESKPVPVAQLKGWSPNNPRPPYPYGAYCAIAPFVAGQLVYVPALYSRLMPFTIASVKNNDGVVTYTLKPQFEGYKWWQMDYHHHELEEATQDESGAATGTRIQAQDSQGDRANQRSKGVRKTGARR